MSFPPEIKVASVVYIMEFSWKPDKCSEALVWGVGGAPVLDRVLGLEASQLFMEWVVDEHYGRGPAMPLSSATGGGFCSQQEKFVPKRTLNSETKEKGWHTCWLRDNDATFQQQKQCVTLQQWQGAQGCLKT